MHHRRMFRDSTRALIGIVTLIAMLVAACGESASTSSSSTTAPSTSESTEPATSPTEQPTGEPIRIGVLFPLSGDGASFGEDNLAGAEIAKDLINEAGGIDGRPIEYIVSDVTTPEQAQTEAERLVNQEGVSILMGTAFSSLSVPATAAAARLGVLYWEVSAASDEISDRNLEGVFQLNAHASQLGTAGVTYAKEVLTEQLGEAAEDLVTGVVYTDDAFGAALGIAMAETSRAEGFDVVIEESYNASATDLTPLILNLRDQEVELLFASTLEADAILLWQQMQQLEYAPKVFMDSVGFDNPATAEAVGESINGAFATTAPVHTAINTDGLTEEGQSLLQEYASRFGEETGRDPSSDSDLAFGGAWALLEYVLKTAEDVDNPAALIAAAESLDVPLGSLPNGYGVTFDENGHNENAFAVVEQWQEGSLAIVGPLDVAVTDPILVPLPAWNER